MTKYISELEVTQVVALVKQIEGLKTENKCLRKALEDIAEFADEQYSKRIPAPSCVEFMTISRYADKALKGAVEC